MAVFHGGLNEACLTFQWQQFPSIQLVVFWQIEKRLNEMEEMSTLFDSSNNTQQRIQKYSKKHRNNQPSLNESCNRNKSSIAPKQYGNILG